MAMHVLRRFGVVSVAIRPLTLGILLGTSGTGQEWSLVATTGPAPRRGAAMAFDSLRGRTVLFGGGGLGDTWEWDGSVWHPQFFVAGPSARSGHAMAFDSRRGVVVLFGGRDAGPYSWDHDDTWLWNGTAWVEVVNSVRPSGRQGHGMVFDSFRGRIVLHGGLGPPARETWEWDGAAGWALRATNSGPVDEPLVFDRRRNRTVALGSTANWDFWEWDGTSWATRQYQNAGPAVSWSVATYDAARDEVILFQSYGNSGTRETWAWSGSTWSTRAYGGPSARSDAAMVFDSHRAVVVMFGGISGVNGYLGDTWHWTGPGSASAFGSGCGVPPLALTTSANSRPIVGTTARATLAHVPSPFAFVAIGWSRSRYGPFPLPVTLTSFGMPGCDLLQSAEAAAEPMTISGPATANYELILPNMPGLIGLRLFLQGWAVAPGANAAGTIVSNGIEWIVGSA